MGHNASLSGYTCASMRGANLLAYCAPLALLVAVEAIAQASL